MSTFPLEKHKNKQTSKQTNIQTNKQTNNTNNNDLLYLLKIQRPFATAFAESLQALLLTSYQLFYPYQIDCIYE